MLLLLLVVVVVVVENGVDINDVVVRMVDMAMDMERNLETSIIMITVKPTHICQQTKKLLLLLMKKRKWMKTLH